MSKNIFVGAGVFGKLTNRDISLHFRNCKYWFMRSDFAGAFAYWVVAQSPYESPDITKALTAFNSYVSRKIEKNIPKEFSYDELSDFISEKVFESIPDIEKLNHSKIQTEEKIVFVSRYSQPNPDYDFIDLGALARNIFYMLLRENITQESQNA